MAEANKEMRLNKAAREFNISTERIVEFLSKQGFKVENKPTTKISSEEVACLEKEFRSDKNMLVASMEVSEEQKKEMEAIKQQEKERLEKERLEKERQKASEIEISEVKKEVELAQENKQEETSIDQKQEEETSQVGKVKILGSVDLSLFQNNSANNRRKDKKDKEKEKPKAKKEEKSQKNKPLKEENNQKTSKEKQKSEKNQQKPAIKEEKPQETPQPTLEKQEKKVVVPEIVIPEHRETQFTKLTGPKIVEKIDLTQFDSSTGPKKKKDKKGKEKDKENKSNDADPKKRKRKRIGAEGQNSNQPNKNQDKDKNKKKGDKKFEKKPFVKQEVSEEDVQRQVRETLEALQGKSTKSKGAKFRKEKRDIHRERVSQAQAEQERENTILKVTEFVTVNELATMMDVPVNKIIGTCMSLGIMATMNHRLDAETLSVVADEFGFKVEFSTADIQEAIPIVEDKEEDLLPRAPIVTVMGHVDHGKTSLLDYIRKENVIAGESGGITQHIGAYSVALENGQKITFLDTPGHEAFTAMRARGASVTDIVIIVIAADESDLMPQTKEAISHAQAANVPIIFAINKIDKPTANPERIKERLAGMNLLVEDWGGKIQSHDISAKTGLGVKELLEKVLLEAEMLELKANPNKNALGTVVEAFLDKGRGFVSTVLVEQGTLKVGDYVLAGTQSGKIRAMHDERGKAVKKALPSTPISILGLDGAPQAGDKFYVFEDEKEAKQIAAKRVQLLREQSVRTQKHITLDEIGRRIALGDFKQLNIILKGDVDGSVQALTDSFQKLSTEEIQVSIIHKGVGAITESDVLLASASDAIIIGFNVRPMTNARALAEKESIDIRTYSIIYDAINDLKDAMEGMRAPEMKEEVTGSVEIRELFKISKVGTIAGCMVTDGKIFRNSKIRLIREGIVIFTGELSSLKRFKDDVKEVSKGYDCGLQIKNYNDIKEYDILEAFQEVEVKPKK